MGQSMLALNNVVEAFDEYRNKGGITGIHNEAQYRVVIAAINSLVDEVREDENHPRADLLNFLGILAKAYEDEHVELPDASPIEVLKFLMEQHNLGQSDLSDCMPQSRVSDVLRGEREISKEMAKCLAARFKVPVSVFL